MIFSRVVYDAQFSFVTIYKVGVWKCFKNLFRFEKSCSVFEPLVLSVNAKAL